LRRQTEFVPTGVYPVHLLANGLASRLSPPYPIRRARGEDELPAIAKLHGAILAASWLLATAVALYAYAAAPMANDGATALETMAALRREWPWYVLCYTLFLITDCFIALLGVLLMAWLAPQGGYRAWAMVVLFALAGTLGSVMDVTMLAATQLFRSPSLLGDASMIAVVLGWLNATTAWFSVASFALSGGASLLVAALAAGAGVGRRWIAFTRALAVYQILVSVIVALATLTTAPSLAWLSVILGVVGTPILVSLWLVSLTREIRHEA
jgi:hypothetical protein